MLKVGLTGGIACGKSTVANYFRAQGAIIIDSDRIAHELVQPRQKALAEIAQTFGREYLLADGRLNRRKMRREVFSQSKQLEKLESILHPRIRQTIKQRVQTYENSLKPPAYVILDIPLLLEKSFTDLIDRILVVDCSPDQQISRAIARDNGNETAIRHIMQAQVSRQVRQKAADDLLDNTGTIKALKQQIDKLHEKYQTSS